MDWLIDCNWLIDLNDKLVGKLIDKLIIDKLIWMKELLSGFIHITLNPPLLVSPLSLSFPLPPSPLTSCPPLSPSSPSLPPSPLTLCPSPSHPSLFPSFSHPLPSERSQLRSLMRWQIFRNGWLFSNRRGWKIRHESRSLRSTGHNYNRCVHSVRMSCWSIACK